MKVIIHSKKTSKSLKGLSESKKAAVSKRLLREFTGLEIGLASLLSFVLGRIFPMLKSLFTGFGQVLTNSTQETRDTVQRSDLPPEAKQEFMSKFDAAEQDLKATLEKLKAEAGKSTKGAERPSAIIAAKVKVLVDVVFEITTKYKDQLSDDDKKKLDGAIQDLQKLTKDLGALDFTAAISSKEDPKGLWQKMPADVQGQFKDDDWLKFTQAYSTTVPENARASFKTAPMATAAPSA